MAFRPAGFDVGERRRAAFAVADRGLERNRGDNRVVAQRSVRVNLRGVLVSSTTIPVCSSAAFLESINGAIHEAHGDLHLTRGPHIATLRIRRVLGHEGRRRQQAANS